MHLCSLISVGSISVSCIQQKQSSKRKPLKTEHGVGNVVELVVKQARKVTEDMRKRTGLDRATSNQIRIDVGKSGRGFAKE